MHETMSGDINSLGHQLNRFSERNRHFRDFTLYSLISTLKEVIACFPVYRTYVTEAGAGQRPRSPLHRRGDRVARSGARRRCRRSCSTSSSGCCSSRRRSATPEECEERARFIGKFQQITSPVAAKGIEDTALYVYNRLLSLNEVGADPTRFGLEPAAVHDWICRRQRQWPAGAVGDVDARHQARRGRPRAAERAVGNSRRLEGRRAEMAGAEPALQDARWTARSAPDPNEEYLLYQTLVGAWPFDSLRASERRRSRRSRSSRLHDQGAAGSEGRTPAG